MSARVTPPVVRGPKSIPPRGSLAYADLMRRAKPKPRPESESKSESKPEPPNPTPMTEGLVEEMDKAARIERVMEKLLRLRSTCRIILASLHMEKSSILREATIASVRTLVAMPLSVDVATKDAVYVTYATLTKFSAIRRNERYRFHPTSTSISGETIDNPVTIEQLHQFLDTYFDLSSVIDPVGGPDLFVHPPGQILNLFPPPPSASAKKEGEAK